MDVHVAISRCEDYSETVSTRVKGTPDKSKAQVARKTKKVLPTIGRLLLVSTFIEDAIRLMFNTREHADWFANLWGLNNHFAYFLTVVMALNLICGTLFVMLRYKVPASCTVLAVTVFSQVVLYELYSTYHILTRNMSILAAILLLVTENMLRKPQKYSQLPRDENEFEVTSVMLCACRLFLNLMLVSMVHFDMSYKRLFLCLISYSMMFFVWTGYKTRMMSFILSGWLLAYNIMLNDFWNRDSVSSQWVRYDFFQALSAVGGLLLLIHTGPGELSIDEMKKKW